MDFKKILIPVNGNGAEGEAVRVACNLAKENKAKVYAVYIIEVSWSLPLDAYIESEVNKGEGVLSQAERFADDVDYELEGELLQAREAGPAIVDEAVQKGVDLIVMGIPFKKRFGEFSLGNTVPYVLKNAPCSVLLCRQSPSKR